MYPYERECEYEVASVPRTAMRKRRMTRTGFNMSDGGWCCVLRGAQEGAIGGRERGAV